MNLHINFIKNNLIILINNNIFFNETLDIDLEDIYFYNLYD